jgi:hypothetical protein
LRVALLGQSTLRLEKTLDALDVTTLHGAVQRVVFVFILDVSVGAFVEQVRDDVGVTVRSRPMQRSISRLVAQVDVHLNVILLVRRDKAFDERLDNGQNPVLRGDGQRRATVIILDAMIFNAWKQRLDRLDGKRFVLLETRSSYTQFVRAETPRA